MDSVSLREVASKSTLFLRVYAALMTLASGRAALQGRNLHTLQFLLRAWRIVGDHIFGLPRIRRVERLVEECCFGEGRLTCVARNELLAEYVRTQEGVEIRQRFANLPSADRVRLRNPDPHHDPERQGNLIMLKSHDPSTGEKGVLLVKYSKAIRRFPAIFDLAALSSYYTIVLEPSWWGYQDVTFLLYAGSDLDVIVLAQCQPDFEFIRRLKLNLLPIRLGAGDWVDPETFRPKAGLKRSYDLVMVASWSRYKRHGLLFGSIAKIHKKLRRTLRVALIGYPQGWTRVEIENRLYQSQEEQTEG